MADTNITRPYEYQPLHHLDSIRILELLPGIAGTTLECKLHEVRKNDQPRFEALSYTWGAAIFPERLLVTETTLCLIHIAENLFQALQALRLPQSSRKLWIDAVCINQQDTSEKGHQVKQMRDIYQDAERVIVWLGRKDCVAGAEELLRIGRDCKLYGFEKIFPFPLKIHDHFAAENLERLIQTCNGDAVGELLDREWFERVWIVQEFILARELVVVSGRSEISYDLFSKAICVLRLMARRPFLVRQIYERECLRTMMNSGKLDLAWGLIQKRERHLALIAQKSMGGCALPTSESMAQPVSVTSEDDDRDRHGGGKALVKAAAHMPEDDAAIHRSTLVEYCIDARNLKCTNERDRVYGTLGFAGDKLSIEPNYEMTLEQVWHDLAVKSLVSGDLTVLHGHAAFHEAT
jgi:hypothetical protein